MGLGISVRRGNDNCIRYFLDTVMLFKGRYSHSLDGLVGWEILYPGAGYRFSLIR